MENTDCEKRSFASLDLKHGATGATGDPGTFSDCNVAPLLYTCHNLVIPWRTLEGPALRGKHIRCALLSNAYS